MHNAIHLHALTQPKPVFKSLTILLFVPLSQVFTNVSDALRDMTHPTCAVLLNFLPPCLKLCPKPFLNNHRKYSFSHLLYGVHGQECVLVYGNSKPCFIMTLDALPDIFLTFVMAHH